MFLSTNTCSTAEYLLQNTFQIQTLWAEHRQIHVLSALCYNSRNLSPSLPRAFSRILTYLPHIPHMQPDHEPSRPGLQVWAGGGGGDRPSGAGPGGFPTLSQTRYAISQKQQAFTVSDSLLSSLQSVITLCFQLSGFWVESLRQQRRWRRREGAWEVFTFCFRRRCEQT